MLWGGGTTRVGRRLREDGKRARRDSSLLQLDITHRRKTPRHPRPIALSILPSQTEPRSQKRGILATTTLAKRP